MRPADASPENRFSVEIITDSYAALRHQQSLTSSIFKSRKIPAPPGPTQLLPSVSTCLVLCLLGNNESFFGSIAFKTFSSRMNAVAGIEAHIQPTGKEDFQCISILSSQQPLGCQLS